MTQCVVLYSLINSIRELMLHLPGIVLIRMMWEKSRDHWLHTNDFSGSLVSLLMPIVETMLRIAMACMYPMYSKLFPKHPKTFSICPMVIFICVHKAFIK